MKQRKSAIANLVANCAHAVKQNIRTVAHLLTIVLLIAANCALTAFYESINGNIVWGGLPDFIYYASMALTSLLFYTLLAFSLITVYYRLQVMPAALVPFAALVVQNLFLVILASADKVTFSIQWKKYLTMTVLPAFGGGLLLLAAGVFAGLLILRKRKNFRLAALCAAALPSALQLAYEIIYIIYFVTETHKNGGVVLSEDITGMGIVLLTVLLRFVLGFFVILSSRRLFYGKKTKKGVASK